MKTSDEIDAEKNAKPRVDIVPPALMLAAGRALGAGAGKHGVPAGCDGFGTWRIAGSAQAQPLTHYASLMRHLLLWRGGETVDPDSGLRHIDCAAAQLAILIDLLEAAAKSSADAAADDFALPEGLRWAPDDTQNSYLIVDDDTGSLLWISDDGGIHGSLRTRYYAEELIALLRRKNGIG